MADKRRRPPEDDQDDDDFGLRTPVKRPTAKHDKKKVEAERRRPEPEPEPAPPPPKKEGSGKRKAVDARTSGTGAAPRPAAGGRSKAPVMLVAGALVAAAVGGGLVLTMSPPDPPPAIDRPAQAQAQPQQPITGDRPGRPRLQVAPTAIAPEAQPGAVAPAGDPEPIVAAAAQSPREKLEELRRRSGDHEMIARLLEQYGELARLDPLLDRGPMFEDFRTREKREQELLEEVRRLGVAAIPALREMLLELDGRAQQIFLAKALAGFDGPEALAAVEDVLGRTKDVALQTTLVRYMPDSPEAADSVARAFGREENPNLRSMLLREYARRLGEGDERGREVFARAALQDGDPNVRAEAVTLIGRRGDPRDQALMEQIINQEQNLPIRQRAIVSYAETGKEQSLNFLEGLARDPQASLPIRASAVLAIGRVGGDRAIGSLDQLAQSDPDQEIRLRAQRLAASLRARQQAEREGMPGEPEGGVVPHGPAPFGR
ncbi:MAG: HEAT repeat domain-containing protein [Planctomycetes bacterium]|nr:HEAT repeat domain-containing protein [Planctomycetota bacterium]